MMFFLSEWFSLVVVILLSVFLFFDEEPFFDATDWNIVHVLLLLFCLWIVVWENVIRAKYGQFVYKDQVLLFSTFSFWFSLENYIRAIVVVFCFHCLSPLELELVELVEVFQSLLCWYTAEILPCLLLLSVVAALTLLLNFVISWQQQRFVVFGIFVVVFVLTLNLLALLWDFVSSSFSSCLFGSNPRDYYIHGRSTLSYNMSLSVEDSYDWHRAQPQTFIFRFEDLYMFYLQLFNIIALYCCVFVWLFLFQDVLTASANSGKVSYIFLGVCTRWVDHALWCFVYSQIAVLLVGLRLSLRVSTELSIWIF